MRREAGILLPVFSLPSAGGIGDFGPAAYRFTDQLAAASLGYWQILPLNAGNPDNGESPYFSSSAFAVDPLLISLEGLAEAGWLRAEEASLNHDGPLDRIDHAGLRERKLPRLMRAAERFPGSPDFDRFCTANAHWLEDHALFEVLHKDLALPWTEWPDDLRDRDPRALDAARRAHAGPLRTRRVLQFFAGSQWHALRSHAADRGLSIVGDMPIYVALDSADTWADPGLFKLNGQRRPLAVSGVPPDYFSATGQLWGNPVYRWETHARSGFTWWVRRLRHLFALYDIVRIDHFRGLVQYWEVPAGEPNAIHGSWQEVPTRALFDTLYAAFKTFPVICEDLGVITDDVREVMKHYGLPGMRVLQFAFADDDPKNPNRPRNYPADAWAYTGTHDNWPTLGWLNRAAGKAERERIVQLTGKRSDDRETVWDLISAVLASPARTAIIPWQDVLTLDERARINDPAVVSGNWRWRWDASRHPAETALHRFSVLASKSCRTTVHRA